MKPAQNPFERYDIDPTEGPRAITERFRELAEEANESERQEIRAAWEELTLHPMRRVRAALGAHPESRPQLGAPPPPIRQRTPAPEPFPTLSDLAVRPSVARALGPAHDRPAPRPLSLDEDPLLKKPSDVR